MAKSNQLKKDKRDFLKQVRRECIVQNKCKPTEVFKSGLPEIAVLLGKPNFDGGDNSARKFIEQALKIEFIRSDRIIKNKIVKKSKKITNNVIHNNQNIVVASNEFLQSYEWRKIRLVALKLHGMKCQCCGSSPKTGAVMNVDHIKPRKTHPELALDINNLQVLCHECNHGKGNWDMTDFR